MKLSAIAGATSAPGAAAGRRTVLLDCGYGERGPENAPSVRVRSLTEAVNWIRGF